MQDDARDDLTAQAQRLLEIWDRLSRAHIVAGGSCSCGVGGFVVAIEDHEQDIADFLMAESDGRDRAEMLAMMEQHGSEGGRWSISALLSSIATGTIVIDPRIAVPVLERLGGTLQSFEKLHG